MALSGKIEELNIINENNLKNCKRNSKIISDKFTALKIKSDLIKRALTEEI